MDQAVPTLTGRDARFAGGLRELAPGTFAWLQPNGAWGEANAGLVIGAGESLLIDTLWDQALAGQMLDHMASLLAEAPLSTALNTHQDGDHWWGNAALPGSVEIITAAAGLQGMHSESTPKELARLGRLAGAGRALPGSIGGLSRLISSMLAPFDFAHVQLRLPDRSFQERRLQIDVGGRSCELQVLGPAHTPGDTIVHLPDVGVVFAADLLFVGAIPVMWHGPSSGWLEALDQILKLDARIFVPGHGDIADRAAVESMQRFWNWLRTEVKALSSGRADALRISESLIASSGFDEWRGWECPERLLISVTALLRELAGQRPLLVSPAVRARLFRQVAVLKQRIEGGS